MSENNEQDNAADVLSFEDTTVESETPDTTDVEESTNTDEPVDEPASNDSTETPETNGAGTDATANNDATPATQTPAPSPVTLSPEQLQQLLQSATSKSADATTQQNGEQKPLTPEERDKLLNVWKPSEQDVSDILEGGEAGIAAMTRMRDGLTRQAFTMARVFMQNTITQMRNEYAPYIQMAQQAQREQETKAFYDKNPDLEPYRDVVNAVFAKMSSELQSGSRKPFSSISEAETALVNEVTMLLKNTGVEPKKTEQNSDNSQQTKKQSPPKMTLQPRGGQRGAKAQSKEQAVSAGMEVFSDLMP